MNAYFENTDAKPNLYLVGLMGTGKSTIGKMLASQLGMNFVDSDERIEKQMGYSISEIFAQYGEKHFRNLEKKFIDHGHAKDNTIVACGGGLCVPQGMMEALRAKGKVICLWATPETLLDRTQNDASRPLLQVSHPIRVLQELLANRESRYREADIMIETDGLVPEVVVENILAQLFPNNS